MPTHEPEIDALYAAWVDAFRHGDVGSIVSLLTPDYLLFAPGVPPVGVEALRSGRYSPGGGRESVHGR
jgi:ketosteroid isomerase-like protein